MEKGGFTPHSERAYNGGPVHAHKDKANSRQGGISDTGYGDPDVAPAMMEGPHSFNKGYVSDEEHFSPRGAFPDNDMRGNNYMNNQNKIVEKDSSKMNRQIFTKIH